MNSSCLSVCHLDALQPVSPTSSSFSSSLCIQLNHNAVQNDLMYPYSPQAHTIMFPYTPLTVPYARHPAAAEKLVCKQQFSTHKHLLL